MDDRGVCAFAGVPFCFTGGQDDTEKANTMLLDRDVHVHALFSYAANIRHC